jgi:hypothetical protein
MKASLGFASYLKPLAFALHSGFPERSIVFSRCSVLAIIRATVSVRLRQKDWNTENDFTSRTVRRGEGVRRARNVQCWPSCRRAGL